MAAEMLIDAVFQQGDRALQDDRGRTRVSRADFAVALIDEAEQARHVREQTSVAY
jgi:putative NADH-flavin reductase